MGVLDELSLYNVSMHKEKDSVVQPLNASEEVGGITTEPKSIYKNKDLIHNSQELDKEIVGISGRTRFRVTPEYKQHQMDIINATNPAPESNYTWIRSVEDIKSFEESWDDSDYADYKGQDFDPSYTWDMAEDALNTGKVTVYSSYPIKNGVFVTPSYMEAQSYDYVLDPQKKHFVKHIKIIFTKRRKSAYYKVFILLKSI